MKNVGELLAEADALRSSGDVDGALRLYLSAVDEIRRASGARSADLINPLLAVSYIQSRSSTRLAGEALAAAKEALDIARAEFGDNDVRTARVMLTASTIEWERNNRQTALEFMREAVRVMDSVGSPEDQLRSNRALVTGLIAVDQYADAIVRAERLVEMESARSDRAATTSLANYQLGLCALRLGFRTKAIDSLERAIAIAEAIAPGGGGRVDELRELLAEAEALPI